MDMQAQRFIVVACQEDVDEGRLIEVTVGEYQVLLGRTGQGYFAVENRCPHQGRPLSNGLIRNGQIICAFHGAKFDLDTGAARGPYTRCSLLTFDVRLRDGEIAVSDGPKRDVTAQIGAN
ncbi:Rieske (2Fe-2S) protein [Chromobacterium sp. IIBBL 290-4]|uniref:Rieske (2Fe-2S) protein n=1 Tax=Chromobacterium sp. IIBBL 290-4 TaxID=2953890 RepID=UPI0020B6CBA8|nr:Rieske (2Fe-2S) protein [Chromobacterium sp. IIBBL 290-4]UTH76456.1 Rieske (2Fe-2S) protein [Chromobacterium sp. IIBBL 290-4]